MYLFVIIDWYSRYIVDFELSTTLDKAFVLTCLKRALSCHQPEIINSDQGGHFTNADYIDLLESCHVKISRFFRTLKYDCVYINEFNSPRELRIAINQYIEEYNTYRPHSSLEGKCPVEIYGKQQQKVA